MKINTLRVAIPLLFLALLGLFTLTATANDVVISSGVDVWWTPADGSTRADFQANPIPAGFFCRNSRPFQGSIAFRGAPIATEPAGAFGAVDTVIHRLDEISFDGAGVAETRIQVAALSLVSMHPIETRCGQFDVQATLTGKQPITRMQVTYDGAQGGAYSAPLDLVVRLTFTPVSGNAAGSRQLVKRVALDPAPDSRWFYESSRRGALGYVLVDTDGDSKPETLLPGTTPGFSHNRSGFSAQNPAEKIGQNRTLETQCGPDEVEVCHAGNGHQHCYCTCDEYYCLAPVE